MCRPHPTRAGDGQTKLSASATPFELSTAEDYTAEDMLAAQKLSSRFEMTLAKFMNVVHRRIKRESKSGKVQVKEMSKSFHAMLMSATFGDVDDSSPSSWKTPDLATTGPSLTKLNRDMFKKLTSAVAFNLLSPDDLESTCSKGSDTKSKLFKLVVDSGATEHVLTLAAAIALFSGKKPSKLSIIEVIGKKTRADMQGRLIIRVSDEEQGSHLIDLGTGHTLTSCPLNLLSVNRLKEAGCAVHFETDNCYFQLPRSSKRIPFKEEGGLFIITATKGFAEDKPYRQVHAYSVKAQKDGEAHVNMATSGDLSLWHRRMRHMPKRDLLRIFNHNLVDGFLLKGNKTTGSCSCDSCRMMTRRRPHANSRPDEDLAIGEKVSSDVKILPAPTFHGEKYVINFVDHRSRFGICYLMKTKTEVHHRLRQYVEDMRRLGVKVQNVQTDRGSEYFEQEGQSIGPERRVHAFGVACWELGVKHIPKAVEEHEAMAESWFRTHFKAVEVMLWEARMSPNFWGDAVKYSQWLFNHTPNNALGGGVAPITLITKKRPRWDKFRVFGCDAYEHIPNNKLAKVPGLPTGRKLIFVGFHPSRSGVRVFDPETRRYWTADNVYFYENFSERQDALRHHDRRRALLKEGKPQPLVMDDFLDSNPDVVRSLYLDPDAPAPAHHAPMPPVKAPDVDPVPTPPWPPVGLEGAEARPVSPPWGIPSLVPDPAPPSPVLPKPAPVQKRPKRQGSSARDKLRRAAYQMKLRDAQQAAHQNQMNLRDARQAARQVKKSLVRKPLAPVPAPLSPRHRRLDCDSFPKPFASAKSRPSAPPARPTTMLRPLRLTIVGKEQAMSVEDRAFLKFAENMNIPLQYSANTKRGKKCSPRYARYMHASTIREALELGSSRKDISFDYQRGFIKFPQHEPQLPGHVFPAIVSHQPHILEQLGCCRREGVKLVDASPAYVFNARSCENAPGCFKRSTDAFSRALETVYETEEVCLILEDNITRARFVSQMAAKVLNAEATSHRSVNIDFSLAPEPTRYEMTLPQVCSEHAHWRKAMDDEMTSMHRFGVFRRVPKSEARGRQVLGAKWVYKRKTNKYGEVFKYRSRLVAQGFRQRAGDSYDPDDIFSPVVHKDTLRLFLSICAAERLRVHQADVKAAFLQAPLKEKIYVKAPPGYESVNANGEEEVLELSKAIYGLKQSSASFWHALKDHLEACGYKSMLGDPCLFQKILPNGQMILACAYVDDVTFGVPDAATCDLFMKELRSRFVIDEDEGAPVEWLLGMAVTQDLEKGTIRMDMETYITKLAHGILTEEELAKAESVRTPMIKTPLLRCKEREVPAEAFDYLSVVGSLMHAANCVRCDVSTAVGQLCRHVMAPGPAHVKAAKRCIMYLYRYRALGIEYSQGTNVPEFYAQGRHPKCDGSNLLSVFADSDYAMDETRRSTMGSVIMLNGGPISWGSVLQKTVATSTCEAEVVAAVDAVKDAVHVRQLMFDLGLMDEGTTIQIQEDNSACIAQAESGLRHVRNAKHYEVKLRFLQQHVVDGTVKFAYCPTGEQLADFFTKPLEQDLFMKFRNRLMV